MEKLTFTVKDKSLEEFASKFMQTSASDRDRISTNNYYNYFKDEIFIKISSGLVVGQDVVFELEGDNPGGRGIKNTYRYSIQPYDSVLNKMILEDFQVVAIKKDK